jgi:hypothetical protein
MVALVADHVGAVGGVVGLDIRTTFESDDTPRLHVASPWLPLPYASRSS